MGIEPIKKTAFDTKPKSLLYARARAREDPLTLSFVQHDFIHNAKSCMVGNSIFLGTADKILNVVRKFLAP